MAVRSLAWNAPGYGDFAAARRRMAGRLRLRGGAQPAARRSRHLALQSARAFARRADRGALCAGRRPSAWRRCSWSRRRSAIGRRRALPCRRRWRDGSRISTAWAPSNSPPRARRSCSAIRRDSPTCCERWRAPWRRCGAPATTRRRACSRAGACWTMQRRSTSRPPCWSARKTPSRRRPPSAACSRRCARRCGTHIEEFPGAGHALCQEQPVEVARAIATILDDKATTHA